jgi:hypothetical protein
VLLNSVRTRVSSSTLYLCVRQGINFMFAGMCMALARPVLCCLYKFQRALARPYRVQTVQEPYGLLFSFSQPLRVASSIRLSYLLRYPLLPFPFTSSKVHVGPSQTIPTIRSLTRSMAGTYSFVETIYAFSFLFEV